MLRTDHNIGKFFYKKYENRPFKGGIELTISDIYFESTKKWPWNLWKCNILLNIMFKLSSCPKKQFQN